jgi:putative Holliday junction resolvase
MQERSVGRILMGDPRHMSGDVGVQAEAARHFSEQLSRYTGKPVEMWDERLTTVEASRVLRESGISIEKRARAVDRLSAVILLQSYLDFLGGKA